MAEREHIVVYKAVADFSELVREAAAAKAAMAGLDKDIKKLGSSKVGRLVEPGESAAVTKAATETKNLGETVAATAKKRKESTKAIVEETAAVNKLGAAFSDIDTTPLTQGTDNVTRSGRQLAATFSDVAEKRQSLNAAFSDSVDLQRDYDSQTRSSTRATNENTLALLANAAARMRANEAAAGGTGGGGNTGAPSLGTDIRPIDAGRVDVSKAFDLAYAEQRKRLLAAKAELAKFTAKVAEQERDFVHDIDEAFALAQVEQNRLRDAADERRLREFFASGQSKEFTRQVVDLLKSKKNADQLQSRELDELFRSARYQDFGRQVADLLKARRKEATYIADLEVAHAAALKEQAARSAAAQRLQQDIEDRRLKAQFKELEFKQVSNNILDLLQQRADAEKKLNERFGQDVADPTEDLSKLKGSRHKFIQEIEELQKATSILDQRLDLVHDADDKQFLPELKNYQTELGKQLAKIRDIERRDIADLRAVNDAYDREYKRRGALGKLRLRLLKLDAEKSDDDARLRDRLGFDDEHPRGKPSTRSDQTGSFSNIFRHSTILQVLVKTLPLLPPLISATVGALGSFTAAFTAATAGVLAFTVSAVGQIKLVKDSLDDFQTSGVASTGPMGQMVDEVLRLKDAYNEFLKATQGPVFDVFTRSLRVAGQLLDKFAPVVNAVSKGLSNLANIAAATFNGAEFTNFLGFLERQAPRAVESFGKAILNLIVGIGNLSVSFEPFIDFFLNGFEKMTATFRDWAAGLSTSDTFREFMDYVQKVGPQLVDIFKDIVDAVINIGVALSHVSAVALPVIQLFAKIIAALPPDLLGVIIVTLGVLSITTKLASGSIGTLVKGIYTLFTAAGGAKVIQILTTGFLGMKLGAEAATAAMKGLRIAILGLGIVGAAIAAFSLLGDLFGSNADAEDKAAEAAERHRSAVEALTQAIYENNGALSANDASKLVQEAQQAGVFEKLNAKGFSNEQIRRALTTGEGADGIREAVKTTKTSVGGPRGGASLKTEGDPELEALVNDFLNRVPEAVKGAQDLAAVMNSSADSVTKWKAALEGVADSSGKTAQRIQSITDAVTSYKEAVAAVDDAQFKLDEAIRKRDEDNAKAAADKKKAEEDLQKAQYNSYQSERKLSEARRKALDDLIDLKNAVADISLNEDEAKLALDKAEAALQKAYRDPTKSSLDTRELELDVRRRRADLRDTTIESGRTRRSYRQATARGIEGSTDVLDAKQGVIDATLAERKANEDLAKAIANIPIVREAGKKSVADATTALNDAKTAAGDAALKLDAVGASLGYTRDEMIKLKETLDKAKLEYLVNVDSSQVQTAIDKYKELLVFQALSAKLSDSKNAGRSYTELRQEAINEVNAYAPQPASVSDARRKRDQYGPGYATGGAVDGPGTSTSDSVPAWLSKGEHVWTAAEVVAAGGHAAVEAIRAAVKSGALPIGAFREVTNVARFATGGAVERAAARAFKQMLSGNPTASLYAGLGVSARAANMPIMSASSVDASIGRATAAAADGSSGMRIGDITINNPVQEKSDRSLRRTVQTLAYLYD